MLFEGIVLGVKVYVIEVAGLLDSRYLWYCLLAPYVQINPVLGKVRTQAVWEAGIHSLEDLDARAAKEAEASVD